jgi:hypothetical protein
VFYGGTGGRAMHKASRKWVKMPLPKSGANAISANTPSRVIIDKPNRQIATPSNDEEKGRSSRNGMAMPQSVQASCGITISGRPTAKTSGGCADLAKPHPVAATRGRR